jgi:hypothetical protein
MGHESQIELWSPKLTTFCFAGFGTNRFRCQEAMKTAGRENPKRWALVPSNRAHGAVGQNNSRSIKWAAKQEKFQPKEKCFFLTSTFIELIRTWSGAVKLRWRVDETNRPSDRGFPCETRRGVRHLLPVFDR